PGPRESPFGALWLAYVRDPDGNKLCALYRPA
ncbi:MAG: VOC family protein, partial [Oxalobacteraceae bacterium]